MTYKFLFNPLSNRFDYVVDSSLLTFKEGVSTYTSLPTTGNSKNDGRIANDTGHLYVWSLEATTGALTDWTDQGDIFDIDWSAITNKPSSSVADIDDAVSKKHSQNTDNILQIHSATDIVDQQQTSWSWAENSYITNGVPLAQTFTANKTGEITSVKLYLTKIAGITNGVTVEIQETTDDKPNGTVLGSKYIDPADIAAYIDAYTLMENEVTFSSPISIISGTMYAIVLSSTEATLNIRTSSVYPSAYAYGTRYTYGAGWEDDEKDLYFKTLMTISTVNMIDNGTLEQNLAVADGITIDGRDISEDGTRLENTSGTNTGDQESSDFTHNDLSGLNEGEYKHLGSAEYTELTSWLDDVVLGSNGSLTIPTNISVYFRDTAIHIASLNDGHLDLTADIAVDLNAPILDFSTYKAQFRDSAIYINSGTDGDLDITADVGIDLNIGAINKTRLTVKGFELGNPSGTLESFIGAHANTYTAWAVNGKYGTNWTKATVGADTMMVQLSQPDAEIQFYHSAAGVSPISNWQKIGHISSTGFTIGGAAAGIDYALTFDGETNDGILTWKEDEDYFSFSDDVLMSSTESLYFRDVALSISSIDDGHLDLTADISIDINGVLRATGNIYLEGQNELRFYEGANYVGFEAPALSADKIWVLPSADGSANNVLKTDGSGNLGWLDIASLVSYTGTFVNADLSTGILTVNHNLGHTYCTVTVINNSAKIVIPDDVTFTSANQLTIDLSSYGVITGTWNYIILDAGASRTDSPKKIQDADADTLIDTEETADKDEIVAKIAGTERLRINASGIKVSENYQSITSNSVQAKVVEQSGWSFVTFTGSEYAATKAITFPVAFTSILGVIVTYIGAKSGSDPTAITEGTLGTGSTGMCSAGAYSLLTTGFTAFSGRTSEIAPASGTRQLFAWRAWGTIA